MEELKKNPQLIHFCWIRRGWIQIPLHIISMFSGFSILSGVAILFYVAKYFFSLRKSVAEVKQGRRNTELTCAEVDDAL